MAIWTKKRCVFPILAISREGTTMLPGSEMRVPKEEEEEEEE